MFFKAHTCSKAANISRCACAAVPAIANVLQCVAVCCSAWQCVAVRCSEAVSSTCHAALLRQFAHHPLVKHLSICRDERVVVRPVDLKLSDAVFVVRLVWLHVCVCVCVSVCACVCVCVCVCVSVCVCV